MGHIVNSVSYRLGNNRYFNNAWFIHNHHNYSYLANQDILIQRFLKRIFGYKGVALSGFILSNVKILRTFNNLDIYIHIHDSCFELWIYDFKVQQRRVFKVLISKSARIIKKNLKRIFQPKLTKFYDFNANFLIYWFIIERVIKAGWFKFKCSLLLRMRHLVAKPINLYLIGLSRIAISSDIVAEFIRIRLIQYYTIWEVLRSVNYLFKTMMRKRVVFGYKIACAGRFSRKQRTTYSWKTVGQLGCASTRARLDYSYRTLALKYSACTVKVWVRMGSYVKRNLIEFIA